MVTPTRRQVLAGVGLAGAGTAGVIGTQALGCEQPDPDAITQSPVRGEAEPMAMTRWAGGENVEYVPDREVVRFAVTDRQPREEWSERPASEYIGWEFRQLADEQLDQVMADRVDGWADALVGDRYDMETGRGTLLIVHYTRDNCVVSSPGVDVSDVTPALPRTIELTIEFNAGSYTAPVPVYVAEEYRSKPTPS